ncbi:GNAT family N-acetyltransferase [Pontiella sulfatireligans]|uniref:BioF2-like acetyltransferase domain-containing protein n=1 Tax=Pontiella sulfatireligans TaxID=2750658 RepID=A0A6C2UPQ0_9BACT|nr:GNAT family N-acetyltransferase [Pontiella sulfatireligans]VGO21294.1 hypothetical protein SCARR_03366 [Pontiella sulfatireligans]
MNGRIQVEKVGFGPELAGLEDEWEELHKNSVRPTIFSTFDYVYTSCLHFKGSEDVFFLLLRDAGTQSLLAVFPLSVWSRKIHHVGLKVVSHGLTPNATEVDKPCPIIDRSREAECWTRFCEYLKTEFTSWDMIEFDELIAGSYLPHNLSKLFSFPRYFNRMKAGPDSPIINLGGEWEEFWGRHRKLRKRCRRLERALGENLSYRITSDPADLEQCLGQYIETEIRSWKEGEMVARHRNFYQELLPKLMGKGQLYFGMMHDRDTVVSIEVAYVYLDRVYFCHGTYSPAYADMSPGMVNSCWFIKNFHGKGFVEGDYLAGFADYVNPWASRLERTENVVVRKMSWKNGYLAGFHLAKKVKIMLKSISKKQPPDLCPETVPQPVAEL